MSKFKGEVSFGGVIFSGNTKITFEGAYFIFESSQFKDEVAFNRTLNKGNFRKAHFWKKPNFGNSYSNAIFDRAILDDDCYFQGALTNTQFEETEFHKKSMVQLRSIGWWDCI